MNKESQSQQAVGYSLSLQMGTSKNNRSKLRGIKPIWSNKKLLIILDRDGTLIEFVDNLGRNEKWKDEVKLNAPVIDILKFISENYYSKLYVASNQSGVAKKYFTSQRVEEINFLIDKNLKNIGIEISGWNYCADVDRNFASLNADINFDESYVKEKTKRKPSGEMVLELLKKDNLSLQDFEKIIVFGDNKKDGKLAENIGAGFIDVKGKNYKQLKEEFLSLMEKK